MGFLAVNKLKLREVQWITREHAASKWWKFRRPYEKTGCFPKSFSKALWQLSSLYIWANQWGWVDRRSDWTEMSHVTTSPCSAGKPLVQKSNQHVLAKLKTVSSIPGTKNQTNSMIKTLNNSKKKRKEKYLQKISVACFFKCCLSLF